MPRRAAVQGLTRAYRELATKRYRRTLTAAMQALAAVKSPAEFIELQQRLIKEGVEAAVTDSRHIAQLTTAVFTAAFEPVKKQLEKTAQNPEPIKNAFLREVSKPAPIPLDVDIDRTSLHVSNAQIPPENRSSRGKNG